MQILKCQLAHYAELCTNISRLLILKMWERLGFGKFAMLCYGMQNKCCHDEFVPKLDVVPTWQGQMRMHFFWLTRLANAMYCTLFFCDPKVRCDGFLIAWITNGVISIASSDQNRSDQFQREQRRLYPGAMCIVFLQVQVRGDAPSMFKLTQPAHPHMNESINQRQVWQRCPWRNGNADKQQQQPTNWSSRVFKTDPSSTTDWSKKLQQASRYTYGWKRTIGAMHMQTTNSKRRVVAERSCMSL